MARFDNAYSRAIAILKIVLPLVALAILSTLFLLSREAPIGEPLPYTDLALGELAREQRLSDPVYTGLTEDGAELRLTADSITPDPTQPGIAYGETVLARVVQIGGYSFDVAAKEGTLNDRENQVALDGGVRIVTSDNYVITSPSAQLRTDLSFLEATGPVAAKGPLGDLTAGGLTIQATPDTGTDAVALFHSGVELIYLPQGAGSP